MSKKFLPSFSIEHEQTRKKLEIECLYGENVLLKLSSGDKKDFDYVNWISLSKDEWEAVKHFVDSQNPYVKTDINSDPVYIVNIETLIKENKNSGGEISYNSAVFKDLESAKRYADELIVSKRNHVITEANENMTVLENKGKSEVLTIDILEIK